MSVCVLVLCHGCRSSVSLTESVQCKVTGTPSPCMPRSTLRRCGLTNTEVGMGAEYPFLDKKNVVGVIFVGTEGFMIIPDYSSYRTFLGPKRTPGPSKVGEGDIANVPHFANFIKAVRSRKPGELN